jgi:hypothetical protein
MKTEVKIAVAVDDAQLVAAHLKMQLALPFELHDSSYKGEYWLYQSEDREEKVEVSYNEDPMFLDGDPEDEAYFEPQFKDFRVLLTAFVSTDLAGCIVSAVKSGFAGSVLIQESTVQLGAPADGLRPPLS